MSTIADPYIHNPTRLYLKYATIFIFALVLIFASLAVDAIYANNHTDTLWIVSSHTYVMLLHELGFALIIALIISIGIEGFARSEHNKLVKRQMDDLKKDVLREALGVIVSKDIFEEVKDLVLLSSFERRDHRSEYHLEVVNENGERFMLCHVTTSYVVVNRANIALHFPIKCYIEKPAIENLDHHVKIAAIFINGKKQDDIDLKKGDDAEPDTVTFKIFKHNCYMQPHESIDVSISYTMVKEANDTEVWKSIYPGNNMTLAVRFPREVEVFDVHSLHRVSVKKIEEVKDAGFYSWRIDKPILPHQGIVFWWRCRRGNEEVMEHPEGPRLLDGEMPDSEGERQQAGHT